VARRAATTFTDIFYTFYFLYCSKVVTESSPYMKEIHLHN